MQPRPFDPEQDLPAVADLLSRTRAVGGLSHPGGIQWWLRDSGTKDDFEAFVWPAGDALQGFALIDGSFVVTERTDSGPTEIEQVEWLEKHMGESGGEIRSSSTCLRTIFVEIWRNVATRSPESSSSS